MPTLNNSKKRRFFNRGSDSKSKKVERLQRIENSILQTLGYSSLFNYPLSEFQLYTFLITKRGIGEEAFKKSLKYLIKTSKVNVKSEKYYLYKTKTVNWNERKKNSDALFKKAHKVAEILGKLPWVNLIAVTGSLSAYNADKNDDIDFFIVVKTNRVWLTRGFTFLILKILNLLRTDKNPSGKICPNIFVGDNSMSWHKNKRNLYVAHEILTMHPVFDRENTYLRFLQKNSWVFKHFGNFAVNESQNLTSTIKFRKNFILDLIDNLAFKMQLRYMKSKQKDEITKRNFIHFNKVDNTEFVLKGFTKIHSKIKS